MSLFEILNLTTVLAICLYVSYTDTRFKKIGNLYTYGLVLFGLVCQVVFVYLGITTLPQVLWLFLGGLAVRLPGQGAVAGKPALLGCADGSLVGVGRLRRWPPHPRSAGGVKATRERLEGAMPNLLLDALCLWR